MSATQKTKKLNGSKWIRPAKRARIYARDAHCCVYCARSIYDMADIVLTLDHVVARELGGGNEETNLVTACFSCNSSKRDLTVGQFVQYLADHGVASDGIRRRVRNATRRRMPRRPKGNVS